MTDALNQDIKLGQLYGYSNNSNGITTITLGVAKNITAKGVSLEVTCRKSAIYSDDPKPCKIERKVINVKGNMLFPLESK